MLVTTISKNVTYKISKNIIRSFDTTVITMAGKGAALMGSPAFPSGDVPYRCTQTLPDRPMVINRQTSIPPILFCILLARMSRVRGLGYRIPQNSSKNISGLFLSEATMAGGFLFSNSKLPAIVGGEGSNDSVAATQLQMDPINTDN